MGRVVHVEIARKKRSNLKRNDVKEMVKAAIDKSGIQHLAVENGFDADYHAHVDSIRIYSEDLVKITPSIPKGETNGNGYYNGQSLLHTNGSVKSSKEASTTTMCNGEAQHIDFKYHTFELDEDGEEAEYMDDDDDDGQSPASHHWSLPSKTFDDLWDSLLFDTDIKRRLMEYVKSAILFSQKGVNSSLISWNKLILLHGPPGTGKTSLAKALAQKAVIQLSETFSYGQLIEINSHSLFSKWFSESGKLVMKMFDKIHELLEDTQCIVFLLIDEVESLAQCRQSADAGNEPTDSIRAVNALLTQIDKIKKYPNVVVLTTSNVVGAIDAAFVDRADLKLYIGPPPLKIVYEIYATCINELLRVGIICDSNNHNLRESISFPNTEELKEDEEYLLQLAGLSVGMSGRILRKIPFLTHANYINLTKCDVNRFLKAMEAAIQVQIKEVDALQRK